VDSRPSRVVRAQESLHLREVAATRERYWGPAGR